MSTTRKLHAWQPPTDPADIEALRTRNDANRHNVVTEWDDVSDDVKAAITDRGNRVADVLDGEN